MSAVQAPVWASLAPADRGHWTDYEWLVVVGGIVSFAMAWAIGANDVANAFGTTVGAKTITLWQACIIAAIFEFVGAMALGGEVAKTVAGSVTDPQNFKDVPEVFAYGMLCALIAAWSWVTLATYLELAVSTTHSIIGAVVGFGLVFGGGGAIVWNEKIDEFPYRKGLVTIFMSWFISPLLSALMGAFLFLINRTFILRRPNSVMIAFWSLPLLVFVTVYINVFFVLYKGAKNELHWDDKKAGWVSAVVSAGCMAAAIPAVWFLKRRHEKQLEADANPAPQKDSEAGSVKVDVDAEAPKSLFGRIKTQMIYSLTVDVHEDVVNDEKVAAMHQAAEVFDPQCEKVYSYLQVFTACCVSFAHGANDVANAIGPFAGIWYVYRNYKVTSSAATPKWILALGGAGIVTGLATYGYNIIKVLGVKMAKMTPSRGYCAELATALTVSIASVYGLPISSTHCIVGAEVGIGAVEGLKHGTNWLLFAKTFSAWIFTLFVSAILSAAVFSYGCYAPSITSSEQVWEYQRMMNRTITEQMNILKAANTAVNKTYGRPDNALAANVNSVQSRISALMNTKKNGFPNKYMMVHVTEYANHLFTAYNMPVVGYNRSLANTTSSQITVPFQA